MQVIETSDAKDALLYDLWVKYTKPREGMHASDLDLCLGKPYYRKTMPLPVSDSSIAAFMLGYAFQHEMTGEPEDIEGELEGIKVSLDSSHSNSDGSIDILEFKSTMEALETKDGTRFTPTRHAHWMRRAMTYCKVFGVNKVRYIILFLIGRKINEWTVSFSLEEITANWQEMLMRKGIVEKAIADKVYPVPDFHESWECAWCENNIPGRCAGLRASPPPERKKK